MNNCYNCAFAGLIEDGLMRCECTRCLISKEEMEEECQFHEEV